MKIEMWDIEEVRAYDANPRQNAEAVGPVAASIREFGFRVPVLVDGTGTLVAGHTRVLAARQLGLREIPVIRVDDLTPEQIRAFRIADNQVASFSTWDDRLLPIELSALQDAGFDMSTIGFNPDELARLMDGGVTPGLTDPDDAPPVPAEPKCRPGELYALDRHRLYVGDATVAEDVQRLMGDERAELLLTDPPYGVGYVGKTKDALTIQNDKMEDPAFRTFLVKALTNADFVMRPGATFYVWHADSEGFNFRAACRDAGWPVRQCLIWRKSVMVMGRQDYQWRHEPCLYGWKPGAAHQWLNDRCQTTVLEFDKPSRSAEHPTMKPVALFAYQINNSCRKGKIVLDLFAGSGTTVIAAEQTGRTAYVMELDPRYADVVIERWERFTGKRAERIEVRSESAVSR